MTRNRWRLKLWTAVATVAMLAGITVQMSAQVYPAPRFGNGGLSTGVVDDWTHHHLVFSNPGTEEEAIQKGTHDHWLKVVNDPRYIMQLERRHGSNSVTSEAPAVSPDSPPEPEWRPLRQKSPPVRDWSLSLGTGGVAPNMSPAKFNFNIYQTVTTSSCVHDYVVFGLNVVGTASQANLVAVDYLYAGQPEGVCGAAPNVKWAYNVSTIGGTVTTSPILSDDGSQVAFVESNGSASVLHVLRWEDSNGTVTAPITFTTATEVASTVGCTAPCMVGLEYDSSHGTTLSSPFYDYASDTLYVGNDNGYLYQITPVFNGTPAVSTANGWSLTGVQVAGTGVTMSPPVLDFTSGNIFVGGSDGNLYAVSSSAPGTQTHIAIGSGSANGGGIVEAPIVDESTAVVIASAAANAASVGGTSLAVNTYAVTVQADTSTPLGSSQVVALGRGSQGTTANLNAVSGTFDNSYYNWSGTGANKGHFYMVGTALTTTSPTLYQIPYSGVGSILLTPPGGSGYHAPLVSITGDGSGATATASGGVDSITMTNVGSGYTGTPAVSFTGGGGGSASGTANVVSGVSSVTVNPGGSGYTSAPTVSFTGGSGSGATGTAVLTGVVLSVNVIGGGTYSSGPTVGFTGGGGTGATATATFNGAVTGVTVSKGGSGYISVPTVTFSGGGGGAGASATANISSAVTSITLGAAGSGYSGTCTVTFSGGGGGSGAKATCTIAASGTHKGQITGVTLTAGGGGYLSAPTVGFSGGSGSGATASATISGTVISVTVSPGGGGYTVAPTVVFSGGGGTGATGTAAISGPVTAVNVTGGGTGYTGPPTVTFTGSGGATATATITEAVSEVTFTPGSGYTSAPTVSFSGGGGGTGATATATISDVISSVTISTPGSGYTTAPTVTISGGSGSGATATSTINVTSLNLNYGGGGYSTAAATITDSGTPSVVAAATVTVNSGNVMTPGTPTTNLVVSSTAAVQTSPIIEIFTNASKDLLFYGYGLAGSVGEVVSENVTTGSIAAGATPYAVPDATGGTSGMVMDNVSTGAQASSIYFSTLAPMLVTKSVNIASVTVPLAGTTYTATTTTAHGFSTGQSVTIAGVKCSNGTAPPCSVGIIGGSVMPNGTFTITVTSTTAFTFTSTDNEALSTYTFKASTGTASAQEPGTNYGAIKLTQAGLD